MEAIIFIFSLLFVVFILYIGIKGTNEDIKRQKQEREDLINQHLRRNKFVFQEERWLTRHTPETNKKTSIFDENNETNHSDNNKLKSFSKYRDKQKTIKHPNNQKMSILKGKRALSNKVDDSRDLYEEYAELNLPPIMPDNSPYYDKEKREPTSLGEGLNNELGPFKSHGCDLKLVKSWHLVYYIPSRFEDITPYSDYILKFKNGEQIAIQAWSEWAAEALLQANVSFDIILRALGSKELYPHEESPLNVLGRHLADELGVVFLPNILKKTKTTQSMHKLRTKAERKQAINDSYKIYNSSVNLNGKNVLILDDIITSGTTMKEILRVLKQRWSGGNYYLFCLGKTSNDGAANKGIEDEYEINL